MTDYPETAARFARATAASPDPDTDPFWVKNRAAFLAAKSTSADPSACGTCRSNVAAGEPVKHDGCAQRATLLHAPDHPYYEILAGFSLEENAKLPARFHIPVFDDLGQPNLWHCAVCWEEGTVVQWPCATAQKYGAQVFTPLHEAETAHEKRAARIAELEDEIVRLRDQQAKDDTEFSKVLAERDRYRSAWKSARFRAQAYGEGIVRHVADRDQWKDWHKQAETELAGAREDVAFLERNTLPDLRRQVQHHQDGKQRWRERAEKAEERVEMVRALCDAADAAGITSGGWFTVDAVRKANSSEETAR